MLTSVKTYRVFYFFTCLWGSELQACFIVHPTPRIQLSVCSFVCICAIFGTPKMAKMAQIYSFISVGNNLN